MFVPLLCVWGGGGWGGESGGPEGEERSESFPFTDKKMDFFSLHLVTVIWLLR